MKYVDEMLSYLEPIIKDIDSAKNILDTLIYENNSILSFLSCVDNDPANIEKFSNQQFIINNLEHVASNEQEYKANLYLVKSNNDSIKNLPQFQNAFNYFNNIINHFNRRADELKIEVVDMERTYEYKTICKKYYNIFRYKKQIEDVDEFIEFLRKFDSISLEDKTGLVLYLLNSNLEYYKTNSGIKSEKKKDDELEKIQNTIDRNKNLLNPAYEPIYEKIGKKLDITMRIDDLVEERVLEKINVRNIILAKKIFLLRLMKEANDAKDYGTLYKYFKEFEDIEYIETKDIDNPDIKRVVELVKGGF